MCVIIYDGIKEDEHEVVPPFLTVEGMEPEERLGWSRRDGWEKMVELAGGGFNPRGPSAVSAL